MKGTSTATPLLPCLFVWIALCGWQPLWAQSDTARPHIVWLVSEDNAKHFMRLYEPGGAPMPHIEALAKKGIVFKHAFSQGAVCSVARSTLISGCHAPRIGAQYHRRMQHAPMPEGLEMFPAYLRKAGYYTSNNSKEDYNLIKGAGVWDESSRTASYRNRKPGQAFFHVQNVGITHEGQLHFSEETRAATATQTTQKLMQPFPYHPNTELYRYTYAWYHDLHRKADAAMGLFIKQLEADDLMEETIIFYYGDHGGVLPRSKGYIYESGLHVPLVVYVPKKWQHLVPLAIGSRSEAFVQFSDFGPTVLNLAGVEVPTQMDGKPFLGPGVTAKALQALNTSFGYADRFDEKYDLVRSLRRGQYKYMRHYQPFNIDGLFNFYRYKMLAYQEWWALFQAGSLNPLQEQFFLPRTPEALYDLEADPHEVHNLAADPAHREHLLELRRELQAQVKGMPDLSFFPEPYFLEKGLQNPVQFGQQHQAEIAQLCDIADLSLLPFPEAKKGLKQALQSSDPWRRYWGLIVCSSFGKQASAFYQRAKKLARQDRENLVRVRAIEFLALNDQLDAAPLLREVLKQARSETEANLMLNTAALLKMVKPGFQINLSKDDFDPAWFRNKNALVSRRYDFLMDQ